MSSNIDRPMTEREFVDRTKNTAVLIKFILIILFLGLAHRVFAVPIDVKTFIPEKAYIYLPIVKQQQQEYFPELPMPWYLGGLIEQESCLSLTHSRCWSPTSQLKSKRELGIGLGQITKAYREDGSVRFDSLADMRNLHKAELKELEWETIVTRPDLQIRTILLMTRDNYKALYSVKNPDDRLDMADSAYNGGLSGLRKERLACGLKEWCDPQKWFDNVEKVCLKGTKPLYGTQTACSINRHHVDYIRHVRMPKYEKVYND